MRYLTEYVEERCQKEDKARQGEEETRRRGDKEQGEASSNLSLVTSESDFALLCLDLDSFKPINDNFGHQKGDQVLRDLGRIFLSSVREGDVVARYGGDEFLIVLNGVGAEEAQRMVRRLQQEVENYDPGLVHAKLGNLRLGVSIGYACFPAEGRDCTTLLSAADSRMYGDKTDRKLGVMAERSKIPERGRRRVPLSAWLPDATSASPGRHPHSASAR